MECSDNEGEKWCINGAKNVIVPEVTMGEEAMIGAGSLVRKEVPNKVVMTGNPARLIRRIDQ